MKEGEGERGEGRNGGGGREEDRAGEGTRLILIMSWMD